MRILLCLLVLSLSAWAADNNTRSRTSRLAGPGAGGSGTADLTSGHIEAGRCNATRAANVWRWAFSALADGYFTLNFNHPSVIGNQLQNFDLNWGTSEINLAKVTIDKSDQQLGFHLDTGFGESMRLIHAADPAAIDHQGLRYVEQMYVIAKPNHTHGRRVRFGQFVTSAGAESRRVKLQLELLTVPAICLGHSLLPLRPAHDGACHQSVHGRFTAGQRMEHRVG